MIGPEERLRADAPLLDAYLTFLDKRKAPFTIPGHKGRTDLVGRVVGGDVPLFGGLDTVKQEHGVLADAERRAARLWGADVCRFSVGGSTHGNQALALAVGQPGDRVAVPRTLHRSLLLGLVLAGLEPVWLRPHVDAATGLPTGVTAREVRRQLDRHRDLRAVFVGDPTYVGTTGDLTAVAAAVHAYGIPLLVDAAWSAHFGFHPALPPHALMCGADALVTSAHKALPAYSQGALVLARTERLDEARLTAGFEAMNTTSPAGSVLASIDAARALLARDGRRLLDDTLRVVAAARARLAAVAGLTVLAPPFVEPTNSSSCCTAPARTGSPSNATSWPPVCRWRWPTATRSCRWSRWPTARPTSTALVDAVVSAVERHRGTARDVVPAAQWTIEPETVLLPREAFFAPHATGAGRRRGGPGQRRAGGPLPARCSRARARRTGHPRRPGRVTGRPRGRHPGGLRR